MQIEDIVALGQISSGTLAIILLIIGIWRGPEIIKQIRGIPESIMQAAMVGSNAAGNTMTEAARLMADTTRLALEARDRVEEHYEDVRKELGKVRETLLLAEARVDRLE
jgi:hypothetical protein